MKEKQKKNKGITLIALVITIIVLLILAGVTVVTLTGDNGLLEKTSKAKIATEEAEIGEQVKLVYLEWQAAKLTGTTENMDDFIKNRLDKALGKIEDVNKVVNSLMITFSNGNIYTCNIFTGKITNITNMINISKSSSENFVGYYADVDTDGIVDGVIFADLLVGNTNGNEWGRNGATGTYEIQVIDSNQLRDYYVSKENYEGTFGTKDVLSPKGSGKDRFYIMSLNDFALGEDTAFYWYRNAKGNMVDYNTATSTEFGTGKLNSQTIVRKWNSDLYGIKDNQDI